MERSVEVAVIGAGTAGLAAVSQLRQANKSFVSVSYTHLRAHETV